MQFLDDLWSALTAAVYDYRIPLLAASVLSVVVLIATAHRRGWFAAARRHPARTSSLAVVALAIGLPLTWYLASPLVIRTERIEPAPVAVATPSTPARTDVPSASASPSSAVAAAPSPATSLTPAPTVTPLAPTAIARGEFNGSDDFHFGRGKAIVIEIAPGRYHLRLEDFSVRNGPDLYVYLSPSPDGYAKGALELGTLKATDGSFGYDLPEGTDPADFASAVIWCKQFRHLFATAPFDRG